MRIRVQIPQVWQPTCNHNSWKTITPYPLVSLIDRLFKLASPGFSKKSCLHKWRAMGRHPGSTQGICKHLNTSHSPHRGAHDSTCTHTCAYKQTQKKRERGQKGERREKRGGRKEGGGREGEERKERGIGGKRQFKYKLKKLRVRDSTKNCLYVLLFSLGLPKILIKRFSDL